MRGKNWLAAGAAVLISGMLLTGICLDRAAAAGDPVTGGRAGRIAQDIGFGRHKAGPPGGMVTTIAEYLGMEVQDLVAERQSGKSFVQIAAEKGKSEQELVDHVVGQCTAKMDELAQSGKITREQADQWKQNITERIKANLNRADTGPKSRVRCPGGKVTGRMATQVAQFLGMEVQDLMAERQSGKSFVQIAAEKGKSEQELVDHVVGQCTARIDELAQSGKITREQADQWKQNITERIKANLNRTGTGPSGLSSPEGQAGQSNGFARGKGPGPGQAGFSDLRNILCPFNIGS